MKIEYLADLPGFISTLAKWHHEQWLYMNPKKTLEDRVRRLRMHNGHNQIPTTVVALLDDRPAGSASLVEHDMDTHMELTPWLASVYVLPEHRRKGIGSLLVQRIESEAEKLGVKTLYLFTPDQEALYARLGWQVRTREAYRREEVVVMEKSLAR